MGKSLVIPRAASFSTILAEIPSLAISSPSTAPVSTPTPSPGPGPAHDAGVDPNPRGPGEPWSARLGGAGDPGAGACHGPGGAAGGERSAARRGLRLTAAGDEVEAARARRSKEIIAAVAVSGNSWWSGGAKTSTSGRTNQEFSRLPFSRGPGFTEMPGQNRPNTL